MRYLEQFKVVRHIQTKRIRFLHIGKSVAVLMAGTVVALTIVLPWEETSCAGTTHLAVPKGAWLVGGFNGCSSWAGLSSSNLAGFSSSDAAFKEEVL